MINKQEIEKALEYSERWLRYSWKGGDPEAKHVLKTLDAVGRFWLGMLAWASDLNLNVTLAQMEHLMNPKPDSDIEKIRKFIEEEMGSGKGYCFYKEGREKLLGYLDELEKV